MTRTVKERALLPLPTVPAYPRETLHAWASILFDWPDRLGKPRIFIFPKPADYDGPQGAHYPQSNVVRLYPCGARADDLATLIHELAHAWSDVSDEDEPMHGPTFRRTFTALFAWLTGYEVDTDDAIAKHDRLVASGAMSAVLAGRRDDADEFRSVILDLSFVAWLTINPPTLHRVTTPTGNHYVASIGSRRWQKDDHATQKKRTTHADAGSRNTGTDQDRDRRGGGGGDRPLLVGPRACPESGEADHGIG